MGIALFLPFAAHASECVAPDTGGTAILPNTVPTASCPEGYTVCDEVFQIISGLPPATTIDIDGVLTNIGCSGANSVCSFAVSPGDCNDPGGTLGGGQGCANTVFQTNMAGTGALSGFSRMINVPVDIEMHFGPRTAGSPIQTFDTDMFRMFGQIVNPGAGDPDFDLFRVVAGTDFGLPSPGHTLLGYDPGGWQVDSFFDLTYRIDFVGAPGGALAGMSGSTVATIRIRLGETITTLTTSTTTTTTTSTTTTTLAPTVYDHLECFKAKDSVRVTGVVDLPTLAGSPYDAMGCTIGPVKKYCTPAVKTVVSSVPAAMPMPGPDLTSDYICYKIKCPKVSLAEDVTDQFGTHNLTKMKQGELCVPAVRVP